MQWTVLERTRLVGAALTRFKKRVALEAKIVARDAKLAQQRAAAAARKPAPKATKVTKKR